MKRGEIWQVDFNPTIGSEINKIRPAIIISNDNIGILPLKIVVPITNWQESFIEYSWMTKLIPNRKNNFSKESCADSYQVKSISTSRFIKKLGSIPNNDLEEITDGVAICIDMNFSF